MRCVFSLTFCFVVLLRALLRTLRALLPALRALFKLATQDEYEWCFFQRLKELKIFCFDRPPPTIPALYFPIQNSSYQLPCCSRRKYGRYKIHSISFSSIPFKKSRILKFEILEQYCFGCRWKESKNLENKTTREYVFVSPVYVSSIWLGWFLILKFSTKGFEIFTSKFRTWAFWMFISFFSTQGFRCSFKNQKPSTQGFEIKISQFST